MNQSTHLLPTMQIILQERYGDVPFGDLIPPPVFITMQGKFLHFDPQEWVLSAQFPVLNRYLNPYGILQGGIISALVDNTIGPLSFLAATPNVTRRLEITYSRSVTTDLGYLVITARLTERNHPMLTFKAGVRDPAGTLYARARAVHYILPKEQRA